MADIEGVNEFQGHQMHSHDYRRADAFKGFIQNGFLSHIIKYFNPFFVVRQNGSYYWSWSKWY